MSIAHRKNEYNNKYLTNERTIVYRPQKLDFFYLTFGVQFSLNLSVFDFAVFTEEAGIDTGIRDFWRFSWCWIWSCTSFSTADFPFWWYRISVSGGLPASRQSSELCFSDKPRI